MVYLRKKKPKQTLQERGILVREKEKVDKRARFERDVAFYQKIWESRPHTCYNCDKPLGDELLTIYMDHILEKGSSRYKHLRYEEMNICILCGDCHQMKTNGRLTEKLLELREYTINLLMNV